MFVDIALKNHNFEPLKLMWPLGPSTQHQKLVFVNAIPYKIKGELSDSFTNYNNVGDTKVSVSIKKLMPTNAH